MSEPNQYAEWLRAEAQGFSEIPDMPGDKAVAIVQRFKDAAAEIDSLVLRLDSGALFAHLTHGDEQHQKWLREALEAYVRGEPRIPPYGQGITEALREKVERTEQWLLAEIRERGSLHLDEHGEGYLSACLNAWQKITGRQEWPT